MQSRPNLSRISSARFRCSSLTFFFQLSTGSVPVHTALLALPPVSEGVSNPSRHDGPREGEERLILLVGAHVPSLTEGFHPRRPLGVEGLEDDSIFVVLVDDLGQPGTAAPARPGEEDRPAMVGMAIDDQPLAQPAADRLQVGSEIHHAPSTSDLAGSPPGSTLARMGAAVNIPRPFK